MRISGLRLAFLSLAAILDVGRSFGQANPQPCSIPLVVTQYDRATRTVHLVEGLSGSDLNLVLDSKTVPVGGLLKESGPKHIVLILDASRKVPKAEWNLETEMAAALVKNARQEDRLVLVLTGLETVPLPFQSPADIQRRLNELRTNRPLASDGSERNYDALKTAASSLTPPGFGDVIFFFGHPEDDGSAATFDQVNQIILRGATRFYGVSFTDQLKGNVPAKWDKLAHSTGYFVSYHSLAALAIAGQKELFRNFLADLYTGIAAPYRVAIPSESISAQSSLEIKVRGDIYQQDVHYPHVIYPCSTAPKSDPRVSSR